MCVSWFVLLDTPLRITGSVLCGTWFGFLVLLSCLLCHKIHECAHIIPFSCSSLSSAEVLCIWEVKEGSHGVGHTLRSSSRAEWCNIAPARKTIVLSGASPTSLSIRSARDLATVQMLTQYVWRGSQESAFSLRLLRGAGDSGLWIPLLSSKSWRSFLLFFSYKCILFCLWKVYVSVAPNRNYWPKKVN